ncbi:MAG: hypothetical protein DRI57_08440 [Deltaproteobacteria bacterium]|nr:MAG: hypothetical protein DRI57_08440 [Deltaproteobacteria bacterium]
MRADTEITYDAYNILASAMDIHEVERFIMLIKRDNFDYTEWRKDLWEDLSLEEITRRAMDFAKTRTRQKTQSHYLKSG